VVARMCIHWPVAVRADARGWRGRAQGPGVVAPAGSGGKREGASIGPG
jgi:hypothetical protein